MSNTSPDSAWVIVTGNIRDEASLLDRFRFFSDLKVSGAVDQVVFSTWIGEIAKFPRVKEAIREHRFMVVESAEPDLVCRGHYLHQMVTLMNALEACPANAFVLRSRTDKCGPADGFVEEWIATFLRSRRFHRNCDGHQPIFQSRIGIMGCDIGPSRLAPVLFFWNDRAYFGRREDLLRLTNVNALTFGINKLIPEQALFTSLFAARWSSLTTLMAAANQQEVISKVLTAPNVPPQKLDELTTFLLGRPLFRAAVLTERHILSRYFFDLQTSENFGLDICYRGVTLDDPIDLDSDAALLYATPLEPQLDARVEIEAIASYLERTFGVARVKQLPEHDLTMLGLRFSTSASGVSVRTA
jgi:hypothetical protein